MRAGENAVFKGWQSLQSLQVPAVSVVFTRKSVQFTVMPKQKAVTALFTSERSRNPCTVIPSVPRFGCSITADHA